MAGRVSPVRGDPQRPSLHRLRMWGDLAAAPPERMSVGTWSWILSGLNLVGLYLSWQIGNRRRWVWLIYVGVEAVWVAYAIDTGSWGFVVSATAYSGVAIRNYTRW